MSQSSHFGWMFPGCVWRMKSAHGLLTLLLQGFYSLTRISFSTPEVSLSNGF